MFCIPAVPCYRGEIRVASEVGVGTTFTIDLPCPCHTDVVVET